MLLAKAFGIWLLILVCAVLNGVLREAVLLPAFGKPAAFVISGVVLSLLIVAVSLVLVPRLGPLSMPHAMYVGVFWLALTLAFEFGFGLLGSTPQLGRAHGGVHVQGRKHLAAGSGPDAVLAGNCRSSEAGDGRQDR